MKPGANTSPFTQVGHVVRTHGIKGELKVLFESEEPGLIDQIEMLYLQTDRGDFYPCRIANLRVEGKGNKISFFVQFEHIADRSSAEKLRGRALFVETDKAVDFSTESTNDEDSLIDFEVLNEQDQSIGLVIDVMDNGAHLIISVATTSGSLLIPVVDEFVLEIHEETKTIFCKNLNLLEDL